MTNVKLIYFICFNIVLFENIMRYFLTTNTKNTARCYLKKSVIPIDIIRIMCCSVEVKMERQYDMY